MNRYEEKHKNKIIEKTRAQLALSETNLEETKRELSNTNIMLTAHAYRVEVLEQTLKDIKDVCDKATHNNNIRAISQCIDKVLKTKDV
jgi:hypothetical protein